VNFPTTRATNPAATKRDGPGGFAPFAALPHAIAADPRLSPTDVRVLLALLFWARASDSCWPSDRSIGTRIARSTGTVQRSLRRLVALGLIERQPTTANQTGRLILLRWRSTPTSPALGPPVSVVIEEGRRQEKQRTAGADLGMDSPVHPAGKDEEEPPTPEDLETWREWAASADPGLALFARAALRTAGASEGVTQNHPSTAAHSGDISGIAEKPQPATAETSTEPEGPASGRTPPASPHPARVKGASAAPIPYRSPAAVTPSRRRQHHQAPKQLLEGIIGQGQAPPALEVWVTRSPLGRDDGREIGEQGYDTGIRPAGFAVRDANPMARPLYRVLALQR
jgi:Helix-turn-helix domain